MLQVMVVDMLEGFTRSGSLSSPRVDALVPRQAEFLRALPRDSLVVFTGDEHEPDDFELLRFPPHCLRGTREATIRAELLEAARDAGARVEIFRKNNFSAFIGTGLDELVSSAPSKTWIVFGCVTDCCVETAVADLVCRGREVTVIRELIDTWDLSLEQVRSAGLSESRVHDAEQINEAWFTHRFPGIWGARVAQRWRDVLSGTS